MARGIPARSQATKTKSNKQEKQEMQTTATANGEGTLAKKKQNESLGHVRPRTLYITRRADRTDLRELKHLQPVAECEWQPRGMLVLSAHSEGSTRLIGAIWQQQAPISSGAAAAESVVRCCWISPASDTPSLRRGLMYQSIIQSSRDGLLAEGAQSDGLLAEDAQRPSAVACVLTIVMDVLEQVATSCGIDHSPVQHPNTGFMALGFNSHHLLVISQLLSNQLGRPVSPTTLLKHPTFDLLLKHVAQGRYPKTSLSAPLPAPNPGRTVRAAPSAVVTSVSYVLPSIRSQQGVYSALSQASSAICSVPPPRWDLSAWCETDRFNQHEMYTQHAGFLAPGVVESFDAAFFGISEHETKIMSPAQRLILERCVQGLSCANQSVVDVLVEMRGWEVGVFVGSCHRDWEHLQRHKNCVSSYLTTGVAGSVLAG